MLYEIIATTAGGDKIHILYNDSGFHHPLATIRDHEFQRFIIKAIQQDAELKAYIKAATEKL